MFCVIAWTISNTPQSLSGITVMLII